MDHTANAPIIANAVIDGKVTAIVPLRDFPDDVVAIADLMPVSLSDGLARPIRLRSLYDPNRKAGEVMLTGYVAADHQPGFYQIVRFRFEDAKTRTTRECRKDEWPNLSLEVVELAPSAES